MAGKSGLEKCYALLFSLRERPGKEAFHGSIQFP